MDLLIFANKTFIQNHFNPNPFLRLIYIDGNVYESYYLITNINGNRHVS